MAARTKGKKKGSGPFVRFASGSYEAGPARLEAILLTLRSGLTQGMAILEGPGNITFLSLSTGTPRKALASNCGIRK